MIHILTVHFLVTVFFPSIGLCQHSLYMSYGFRPPSQTLVCVTFVWNLCNINCTYSLSQTWAHQVLYTLWNIRYCKLYLILAPHVLCVVEAALTQLTTTAQLQYLLPRAKCLYFTIHILTDFLGAFNSLFINHSMWVCKLHCCVRVEGVAEQTVADCHSLNNIQSRFGKKKRVGPVTVW